MSVQSKRLPLMRFHSAQGGGWMGIRPGIQYGNLYLYIARKTIEELVEKLSNQVLYGEFNLSATTVTDEGIARYEIIDPNRISHAISNIGFKANDANIIEGDITPHGPLSRETDVAFKYWGKSSSGGTFDPRLKIVAFGKDIVQLDVITFDLSQMVQHF